MTSTFSIVADSVAGKHFEITLEKTADDKGQIRLESWHSNKDYRRDPATTDDVVNFYDIRCDRSRRIVLRGDLRGSSPTITCMFNDGQAQTPPFVRVVIQGAFAGLGDGTNDYPLEKSIYDELKQFILGAGFPTP
jgi:hypothetical protein